MDFNDSPLFTEHIIRNNLLAQDPFFLVDVGASGGIHSCWDVFADTLRAIGFEPLTLECERLNQQKRMGIEYLDYFITAEDKSLFEISQRNYKFLSKLFQRSSAASGQEIDNDNYIQKYFNADQDVVYTDKTSSLDQFFSRRDEEKVDFIKIDTDGFDYYVLHGAQKLIESHQVLGIMIEAQFHGINHPDANMFCNIDRVMRCLGFSLFGLDAHKYTKKCLPGKFVYEFPAQTHSGQVMWGDALYLRDLVLDSENHEKHFSVGKLLKLACLHELFNMPDGAVELLNSYREILSNIINVDFCRDLLTQDMKIAKTYEEHMDSFKRDYTSFYPNQIAHKIKKTVVNMNTLSRLFAKLKLL